MDGEKVFIPTADIMKDHLLMVYYDGDIKFARANGNGLFVTKKGEYRGQFKDNVRHGHGTEKTADL